MKPMKLQAIATRWLGPTNCKGARIKAIAGAGSITRSYDHTGADKERAEVAKELADKYGWAGAWFEGGMPGSTDTVYVQVSRYTIPADEYAVLRKYATFVTEGRDELRRS
jgi:hypothetical protein